MSDHLPPPTGDPVPVDPVPVETPADVPLASPEPVEAPAPIVTPVAASYAAEPPSLGAPELLAAGSVLPSPEPPRRRVRGRTVVAATLGVLLVLVAGGAAYGWSFLNRPDVKLARAFDATRSSAGDLTVSLDGTGSTSPRVRYAWTADGTVQVQVAPGKGAYALDLISSGTHVILRVDASAVPDGAAALDQLRTIADTFGSDGAALTALADGKPVGIPVGPGSRFQKLIDEAGAGASASASPGSAAVQQQVAALADAVTSAIKDNVTVTAAGSDQYGDRSTLTLPLKPVVTAALGSLKSSIPALGDMAGSTDLSGIEGRTVHADVWVTDGRISRIAVPLDQLGDPGTGTTGTLVVAFGSTGVQQPTEKVTEVTDALLDKILGGLPALGGASPTG